MKKNYALTYLLFVAVIASVLSFFMIIAFSQIINVSPAFALQANEDTQQLILYAGARRDTEKDESFIFYNKQTGDIWVYRNAKFKIHYRVSSMGQNLEKIKD